MRGELVETIKVEDGKIFNLTWHNRRLNSSRLALFNQREALNLAHYIEAPQKGLFRCRILYEERVKSVEFIPYTPKKIEYLKVVKSNISYPYKRSDRSEIQELLANYNEIIIEKAGYLTDTSIANIAFYNGKRWITPKKPLLEGTTRARLIDEGFLKLDNISKEQIKNYSHFALMNAMIGFQIQKSINIRL